jgi:hypothetical protein
VCAGESAKLSWRVRGNAALSATPPLDGTGEVPSSGSREFAIAQPTVFEITAKRHGKTAFARQEVTAFATGATRDIVFRTDSLAPDSLIAAGTIPPADWDDELRIDTVSGQSQRQLRVVHEGRDILLPADGSASDALRGARVGGRWEIRSGLLAGETIGGPHAPPDRLRVVVRLSCGG